MKDPARILMQPGAALVFAVAIWGVVHGQPTSLPPPSASEAPVAPIFADAPASTPTPRNVLPRRDATLHEREDALEAALDAALRDGVIDRSAGARALLELDSVRHTEGRLRRQNHGELTDTETFRLEGRLRTLSTLIRGRPVGSP